MAIGRAKARARADGGREWGRRVRDNRRRPPSRQRRPASPSLALLCARTAQTQTRDERTHRQEATHDHDHAGKRKAPAAAGCREGAGGNTRLTNYASRPLRRIPPAQTHQCASGVCDRSRGLSPLPAGSCLAVGFQTTCQVSVRSAKVVSAQ